MGIDLIKQLYITNLTKDKHSFDFNDSFSELCISLIDKAQQAGQIRNQQNAEELFIASSLIFAGIEVFWSIKDGAIDRQRALIRSLEALFDIAPEYSVEKAGKKLLRGEFSV